MFVNLKIKFKGVMIEFKLHEVVYLALQVVNSIQEKTVPLNMEKKPNHPPDDVVHTTTDEKKWVKEVAAHIVPFSIGPLKEPIEWLGVARGIASQKNQDHIAINVNGKIISVRLADLYSSDYGLIQSIAHELFETTFEDPWEDENYAKAHEAIFEEFQEIYRAGRLDEMEKKLRENIERDFEKDMQESGYDEEEISELKQQIATMSLTDDFIPMFLQKKKCIETNRQIQQSSTVQNENEAEKRLDVLKSKMDAVNRGNLNLLPRSDDAFSVPLSSFSPNKTSFIAAQEKINKGPSYQKFEEAFQNNLHYFSDVEIAKLSRQMLSGELLSLYPNYLPNLLVAWFICENSRNNLSMLSSLILLDFMQNQIKYHSNGYNLYEFRYILRNPQVGKRGAEIQDIYGRKLGPDRWGGMHPMACDGSYDASKPLQLKKNKTDHYITEPLTIVRQKEGSLILHWLFCILQREFPEINLVGLKEGEKLPLQFNYDEVITDATNTANPKLPCGLKIEKTNSVALNKKIREVKNKILKIIPSANEDEEQAKILEELLPLKYKQELIQTIVLPLLAQRLTTFASFESLRPSTNCFSTLWYNEDIIQCLLKATLADSAIIMSQTQIEHNSLLEDNLRNALFQAIVSGKPIVIPLHLHDNHWSAMVVKKNRPDYPSQVIYNDSLGNPIETELSAAIIVSVITAIDPNSEIIDLMLQQQTNGYDCGPIAIDNLIRLAQQPTKDLSYEQLRNSLFQPLAGSSSTLRQQQRNVLGNLSEIDLIQLCHSTREKDAFPKLQSHPYEDRELIKSLWSVLPDASFVNEALSCLAVIEISLKSSEQYVSSSAKKFMVDFLKYYIAAYKKELKQDNQEIIKLLELQLANLESEQPFVFINNLVKYLVTEFLVKQFLGKELVYKDKLKHHQEDNFLDHLVIVIRGAAVLAQAQSKLQSSIRPNPPWIDDVLRFIKSAPNGHILLQKYYLLYAGLECVKQAVKKGSAELNKTFTGILLNFNNWLVDPKNKNYLSIVFKLFITRMSQLNMQDTPFYRACYDQVQSFESTYSQNIDIIFNFLVDLKCFEMLYILKNELVQAKEEDKKPTALVENKSPIEQKFFSPPLAKQNLDSEHLITNPTLASFLSSKTHESKSPSNHENQSCKTMADGTVQQINSMIQNIQELSLTTNQPERNFSSQNSYSLFANSKATQENLTRLIAVSPDPFYMHRKGLSCDKKEDDQVKKLLHEKLSNTGFEPGCSLDAGDCFYDSCAQGLNLIKKDGEYTTKSLRLLCHEYVVALDRKFGLTLQNWIYQYFYSMESRTASDENILKQRAEQKYHEYMGNVAYTAEEVKKGFGLNNSGLATWGEQNLDGKIICEKLGIKIHMIEMQGGDSGIVVPCDQLRDEKKNRSIDQADYTSQDTIHLIAYRNHFVPVLPRVQQPSVGLAVKEAISLQEPVRAPFTP